jgi:uncharacterized membrane protein (DUF2068 family)
MSDSPAAAEAKRTHLAANRRALRTIAIFESAKGIAALAASAGLLELAHRDIRQLAEALIGHFGLHAEARFPSLFLHYAEVLGNANLRNLVLLAWGYAAVRLLEGYGLWRDLAWAEWLAALSGALYIPLEVEHLQHRPNLINTVVLLANIGVVLYMAYRLWRRLAAKRIAEAARAMARAEAAE